MKLIDKLDVGSSMHGTRRLHVTSQLEHVSGSKFAHMSMGGIEFLLLTAHRPLSVLYLLDVDADKREETNGFR